MFRTTRIRLTLFLSWMLTCLLATANEPEKFASERTTNTVASEQAIDKFPLEGTTNNYVFQGQKASLQGTVGGDSPSKIVLNTPQGPVPLSRLERLVRRTETRPAPDRPCHVIQTIAGEQLTLQIESWTAREIRGGIPNLSPSEMISIPMSDVMSVGHMGDRHTIRWEEYPLRGGSKPSPESNSTMTPRKWVMSLDGTWRTRIDPPRKSGGLSFMIQNPEACILQVQGIRIEVTPHGSDLAESESRWRIVRDPRWTIHEYPLKAERKAVRFTMEIGDGEVRVSIGDKLLGLITGLKEPVSELAIRFDEPAPLEGKQELVAETIAPEQDPGQENSESDLETSTQKKEIVLDGVTDFWVWERMELDMLRQSDSLNAGVILSSGDEIRGNLVSVDQEKITLEVRGTQETWNWSEIQGFFQPIKSAKPGPIEGWIGKLQLSPWPGAINQPDELVVAWKKVDGDRWIVVHPDFGELRIPTRLIRKFEPWFQGTYQVFSRRGFHLGSNHREDFPLPEPDGTVQSFDLDLPLQSGAISFCAQDSRTRATGLDSRLALNEGSKQPLRNYVINPLAISHPQRFRIPFRPSRPKSTKTKTNERDPIPRRLSLFQESSKMEQKNIGDLWITHLAWEIPVSSDNTP